MNLGKISPKELSATHMVLSSWHDETAAITKRALRVEIKFFILVFRPNRGIETLASGRGGQAKDGDRLHSQIRWPI